MNVLTFDIEEWFHILDNRSTQSCSDWEEFESRIEANMPRLLELLAGRKQKATFFFLGWIAERHPAMVKEIDRLGHEIGTHSHMHQLVYTQSREEFKADLLQKKVILISSLKLSTRIEGSAVTIGVFLARNAAKL